MSNSTPGPATSLFLMTLAPIVPWPCQSRAISWSSGNVNVRLGGSGGGSNTGIFWLGWQPSAKSTTARIRMNAVVLLISESPEINRFRGVYYIIGGNFIKGNLVGYD